VQPALKSPGIANTSIAQILTKYCGKCHGPDVQEAGIDFRKLRTSNDSRFDRDTWMKVDEMLHSQAMPPSGEPTPPPEDRTRISQWIRATFAAESSAGRDPRHVTFRRLNRAEYDNTIRDLVGLDLHLARDFPSDDVGEGFDNIGDVLSLPPLLFEKYLDAAERIAEAAILAEPPTSKSQRRERQELRGDGSARLNDYGVFELNSAGSVSGEFNVPRAGEFALSVEAGAQQAGPETAKVELSVDGSAVGVVDVIAPADQVAKYSLRAKIPAGKHRFSARLQLCVLVEHLLENANHADG
jgi:hypothetical protein